ncbi:NAPDH dehydrogenase [Scheffersomyces xylosifermentans]|uniref:NAPDH dehydrogenase n=1 Tax=Scheffersomyces xylosifermentans TaxID=1304137 RepID=UPI00315D4F48
MTVPDLKATNLLKPIKVGKITLQNRVVHLPTTRNRASSEHIPTDLNEQYYSDRSISPGTLLISEATLISEKQGLLPNVPGIWNKKQVNAWKKVTDGVHKKGSFITLQLGALGRAGNPASLKADGFDLTAPSPLYSTEEAKKAAEDAGNPIREFTQEEIEDLILNQYTNAAKNGIAAGFDIIEMHAASGYLLEQFINPSSNKRTDKYGGSIENRSRFVLELIDQLASVVDAERLAIRLSPFSTFQGMLAENEEVHPIASFGYILSELQRRANEGNKLAYVSLVDSRLNADWSESPVDNSFAQQIWKGIILRGGNYTYDDKNDWKAVASDVDADDRTLIGFGRHFIANPDLVERLKEGHKLNPYDRDTFYTNSNYGYNTYPTLVSKYEIDIDEESKRFGKSLSLE